MKFFPLIFFLLFWLNSAISSSTASIDTNANFVIAQSGLNLRASPSIKGEVLALIPFASRIIYLSELSFGKHEIDLGSPVNDVDKVEGHWVKVKYKNITGYVLDAYLYYQTGSNSFYSDGVNRDYLIIRPGCGCNDQNFYNVKDWSFKALIEDEKGFLRFETTDLNYIRTRNYTCDLYIYNTHKVKGKIKYILAEKKGQNILSGKNIFYRSINFEENIQFYAIDNNTKISVSYISRKDDDGIERKLKNIELKTFQKNQSLSFDLPAFGVDVICDLDNDGIMDYIIDFSAETGFVSLYLSSLNREKKKLVKEVARFHHQYCC